MTGEGVCYFGEIAMEWALIFVLSSGIWDTGLRYNTYADCHSGSFKSYGEQLCMYRRNARTDTLMRNTLHSKGLFISSQDKDVLVQKLYTSREINVGLTLAKGRLGVSPSKPE